MSENGQAQGEGAAAEQSPSVLRVQADAERLGLEIAVLRMPATTRTARDAADACGCDIAQIVKSLIFEGEQSGRLGLFLVSGAHPLSEVVAEEAFGEPLRRADPRRVRSETGFAIGGVAPIGHLAQPPTFMDAHLLTFDIVWAAAGAPNAVFSAAPQKLSDAVQAQVAPLGAVSV